MESINRLKLLILETQFSFTVVLK